MTRATARIGLFSLLALLAMSSLPSQSAPASGASTGILISAPAFMSVVNRIPSDRLRRADISDRSALVTLRETAGERDLTVRIAVAYNDDHTSERLASEQVLFERAFRNAAAADCSQPVRFARSPQRPNVAAAGAVPIRLDAECDRAKDAHWPVLHRVEEAVTNGAIRCSWYVEQKSRSQLPIRLPVQDICRPSRADRSNGTGSISIIRPGD